MSSSRLPGCIAVLLLAGVASLSAATMGVQEPAGYSSRIDGSATDFVFDSASDAAGNVLVVGRSRSSVLNLTVARDRGDDNTGRPGVSQSDQLVANTNGGGFVIKYNSSGDIVWKRFVGSHSTDSINGVTTDAAGNVYVVGTFGGLTPISFGGILSLTATARSNVNFNNTLPTNQGSPAQNVFVAMLDPDGNWLWARQFEYALFPSDVNANSAANLGVEVSNGAPVITTDADSNPQRSIMDGNGHALLRDSDGNLYVKMRVYGTVATPANSRVYWVRTGGTDTGQVAAELVTGGGAQISYSSAFIGKLAATPPPPGSPAGTLPTYDWRWIAPINSDVPYDASKQFTSISITPHPGSITGMALDSNGSLYVTGAWAGALVALGPQPAPTTATTAADGYVLRLRTIDSAPIWFARYRSEGGGGSFGGGLVLDEHTPANVFLTGAVNNASTLRFISADTSSTTRSFGYSGAANTGFFIAKVNPSGQWLWSEVPAASGNTGVTTK
ncbi:MAG TPA: SBBP repeat-containing protein, partial [Chthoniobacterales bacterium]